MPRDIVVIGGSAGAIEALHTIIIGLPPRLPATIFVVVHVPADFPSILPQILTRMGPLPAEHPIDNEAIRLGHIYVAPPDHHLTIEDGRVRVQRGPRENRHRPAIDPLFRSAAREYGSRVIGIVLSGLRDDGSAGLYAVKHRGGVAIVQNPDDSIWREMPQRAIDYVHPQFVCPVRAISEKLVRLIDGIGMQEGEAVVANNGSRKKKASANHRGGAGKEKEKEKSKEPVELDKPDENLEVAYPNEGGGTPSVFACPECHGVLWELKNKKMTRFRCRVGHSYGTESLAKELSMASENALWAAVRALEEKAAIQRRTAQGMGHDVRMSARLLDQCAADETNAHLIRNMIFRRDEALEHDPEDASQEPGLDPAAVGTRQRKAS